ncbi:hypothetical protein DFP72DRAFT_931487 [Ephemerocybe angulata]|uniref:Uncharacterized protein n=1 Tax=Ephemerocybe angulata TaxID=980116 RepID=A0A8H6HCU9_9AGAR|nr:hypothetical protein DFP72DRAFT_931487 [Tulosesus angulatus]
MESARTLFVDRVNAAGTAVLAAITRFADVDVLPVVPGTLLGATLVNFLGMLVFVVTVEVGGALTL